MSRISLPLYIARHISLGRGHGNDSSGIIVAVTGIALSIAVMMISISVMSGFKDEISERITGFEAQISIGVRPVGNPDDDVFITADDVEPLLEKLPYDATCSFTVRQPAIIKTPGDFTGIVIKGVDNSYDWDFIESSLTAGSIPDYSADSTLYQILVSGTVADFLKLSTGDKVDGYFLGDNGYKARRLKIAGIYNTHFSEYDRNTVYGSLSMIQQVAGVADTCATLAEINGLPDGDAIDNAETLLSAACLDRLYSSESEPDKILQVSSIHQTAAVFYSWLDLLDTNVSVILSLMGILSALTLISSLFILVLRRVNMIGILKSIGASSSMIRTAFIILTCRILLYGLLAGNILGLGLLLFQKHTGFFPLDPEAYYLDRVPVSISVPTIILLNIVVIIASVIILILPSSVISSISPSKAIRYE